MVTLVVVAADCRLVSRRKHLDTRPVSSCPHPLSRPSKCGRQRRSLPVSSCHGGGAIEKKKSASPWLALTLVKPSEKSPPLHSHPAIIAHRLEAIPNQPRISRPHSAATLLGTTAVSVNRLAKTTVPNPKNPNVTTRKAKRQKNDSSI